MIKKNKTPRKLSISNTPGHKRMDAKNPALAALFNDAETQLMRCMYIISSLTEAKNAYEQSTFKETDQENYNKSMEKLEQELTSFKNLKQQLVGAIDSIKDVTSIRDNIDNVQKVMDLLVKLAHRTQQAENNIPKDEETEKNEEEVISSDEAPKNDTDIENTTTQNQ